MLLGGVHRQLTALWFGAQPWHASSVFRVLQGAGGGGFQPMAQAILADTFPPQQRGLAFALYGITAIMAPTIGPTLADGSLSTIPGAGFSSSIFRWVSALGFSCAVSSRTRPICSRLRAAGVKLDYIGIALLTLGIGALQVLLDKGQEDDWFGSHVITTLVVVAVVCLVFFVIWEWFQKNSHHRRSHVSETSILPVPA